MPKHRLAVMFLAFTCGYNSALADTLIFAAQWDPTISATNYSWFNANNWWVSDGTGNLVPASRVPTSSEGAVITGLADASASAVRVDSLTLTNQATVANGTFGVVRLLVQSGGALKDAHVNVLTSLQIGGTNCVLDGTTLTLLSIGSGWLSPLPPASQATLYLDRGSVLWVAGQLNLADGSLISTLGAPQSIIFVSGTLAGTNNARIRGSASNHLAIDNSGLIRVDGGTLTFEDGIDWQSSANLGEFRAADTNSELLFSSPMQVPAVATSLFTGPGISRFAAGATIDGQAQVGMPDATGPLAMTGNLVVDDSTGGSGTLHVVGSPTSTALVTWNNGTFSISGINVDSGAEMDFAGGPDSSRVLSGCIVTNLGLCALLSPDLSLVHGASIHNETGGVFELRADGMFSGSPMPGGGEFDNAGLFRKTTAGTTSFAGAGPSPGPDFNNTGLIDLQSGGLNLCGGTSSGEFRTSAAASLWFWGGTHVLKAGCTFSGDGPVRLLQGTARPGWLVTGSITANRVELGTNSLVAGFGKTSLTPIRISRLDAHDNGTLTNGVFEVQNLELKDQVAIADSAIAVLQALTLRATNCGLSGSTLNITAPATAQMGLDAVGQPPRLWLGQGAELQIAGQFSLGDNALITGGGAPQNRLAIQQGGTLNATNSATVRGAAAGHLGIDNSGLIEADSGTLAFEDGIDWQSRSGTIRFHAAAVPALILFASPLQLPTGMTCIFDGPGTNRLAAGGSFAGTAQVGFVSTGSSIPLPGNLELNSSLAGPGTLRILGSASQGSTLVWNSGTLSLAALNIDAGGRVLVGGDASTARELTGCVINNSGLFSWPGQTLNAGAGAMINNLLGGTVDLQGDATVLFNNLTPQMVIRNSGSFIKSAGAGSSVLAADFINSGRFEIRTGNLEVQGALAQDQGSSTIQAGTTLSATAFTVRGGTVSGAGVINAVVDNGGIIGPGIPVGLLTLLPGKDFHQASTGVLQIEIGGSGPGSQQDELVVGGTAQLSGTLDLRLVNGFVAQIGQTFTVLTCASLLGAFSTISGVPPPGTSWVPRYSNTNVNVTLAKALNLATVSVGPGVVGLSFNTTVGFNYVVEVSEQLNPPYWRIVQTVPGDGLPKSFLYPAERPQRFYRIQLQ